MKKMMSLILALATVSCGVSLGGANRLEKHLAVVKNGDIFKVIYQGPGFSQVKVTISDNEGNVVFSEKLPSQSGFIRPYNFSELPKGDYKICVSDKSEEYSEKVSYREVETEWSAHVARLKADNQKYLVTIPCHAWEEVAIQIFDRNNELVYDEKEKLEGDFARVYNLQRLDGIATFHLVNKSTGEEKYFSMN